MNRLMPIAIFFGLVGMLPSQTAIAHPGHGGLLLQHMARRWLLLILWARRELHNKPFG
jgi:hypothetical protein